MTGEDRQAGLALAGRAAQELLIQQADTTQWDLPEQFTAPQLVGVSWYRACVRLAQACLVLQDEGLGHEAASLRRSLLEHMTALVWLADSGEIALDALQRGHQQWLKRLTDAMQGEGWPDIPPPVREVLEAQMPANSEEHLQHMTQRLDAFELRSFLPSWIHDTGVTHPCLTSARYFYWQFEDGSVSLLDLPAAEDPLPTLSSNAVVLMLATLAMDRLFGGRESLRASAAAAGRLLDREVVLPRRRTVENVMTNKPRTTRREPPTEPDTDEPKPVSTLPRLSRSRSTPATDSLEPPDRGGHVLQRCWSGKFVQGQAFALAPVAPRMSWQARAGI